MQGIFWFQLLGMVILLMLSGFFSSSETALFSLKRNHRQSLSESKPEAASVIERLLAQPRRLIVTILIGNETANVAASTLSAAILLSTFGPEQAYLNLFVMVPLLLLFGEITPKTLAIRHNQKFAAIQAPLLDKFAIVISPLRRLVRYVADWFITLLIGHERSEGNIVTEDMMRTLAADALKKGALDTNEAEMIHQIFDFGNITAEDVMTPRSDMSAIPLESSLPDVLEDFKSHRHTKIPVYGSNRDNIEGVLFARDLIGLNLTSPQAHLYDYQSLLREAYFVPESKAGSALFNDFREKRITIAIVVDEYGGIVGLVTMEDLLETIFGDIYSPSEEDTRSSMVIEDGRYLIDGAMEVDHFNDEFKTTLNNEHAETIGGLIFHTLGELPSVNTKVNLSGIDLEVKSMDENRIEDVEVRFLDSNAPDEHNG